MRPSRPFQAECIGKLAVMSQPTQCHNLGLASGGSAPFDILLSPCFGGVCGRDPLPFTSPARCGTCPPLRRYWYQRIANRTRRLAGQRHRRLAFCSATGGYGRHPDMYRRRCPASVPDSRTARPSFTKWAVITRRNRLTGPPRLHRQSAAGDAPRNARGWGGIRGCALHVFAL